MLFSEFPSEVVSRILRFVDPSDIRTFQLVCRRWHTLVTLDPFLQYILELDLSGYVLPSVIRTDLSHAEKIQALRDHQSKWEQTEPISSMFIDLSPVQGIISKQCFVDGIFAYSVESGSALCSIYFHELPSRNKGTEYRHWCHKDLGIDCDDFLIQPEQDLLVLLGKNKIVESPSPGLDAEPDFECYQLHFRTMSTNKPHSAARTAFGPVTDVDSVGVRWVTHMQIHGRLVLVVIRNDREESETVWIVDWIAGVQVTSFERSSCSDYSASLLSERYLVTPYLNDPLDSSDLLADNPSAIGSLEVHHIPTYSADAQPIHTCRVARFVLPNLRVLGVGRYMQLHSIEVPLSTQPSWSAQPQSTPKIFQPLAQNLLGLRIVATTAGILYIRSEYLVAILDQKLKLDLGPNTEPEEPLQIPWEEWGSETSWLNEPRLVRRPLESISGLRASAIHRSPESLSNAELNLVVLDFDSTRCRRQKGHTSKGEESHLSSPDTHDRVKILEESFLGGAVRARGVHRCVKKRLKGSADMTSFTVMIGDEHFLAVRDLVENSGKAGAFVYSM